MEIGLSGHLWLKYTIQGNLEWDQTKRARVHRP